MDTEKPLAGKTALVTGSGQNIGRAIALMLADAGADIVVNGLRNKASVDTVVGEVEEKGVRAVGIMCDVSDAAQVETMVRKAAEELGSVDICVSNVGLRPHSPFESITVEEWDSIIRTNLSSAFYVARCVVPLMKAKGWGRFVHISGYCGFTGHVTNRAHNVACKAGLHAFSKAIGREMGPYGITANTVVPGAIDTDRDWSQYPQVNVRGIAMRIPVRRWGVADEIAQACLYLCGPNSGFVNGQAIHLNGGEFMF